MKLALLTVQALAVAAVVAGVAMIYLPAAYIVGGSAVAVMVERNT